MCQLTQQYMTIGMYIHTYMYACLSNVYFFLSCCLETPSPQATPFEPQRSRGAKDVILTSGARCPLEPNACYLLGICGLGPTMGMKRFRDFRMCVGKQSTWARTPETKLHGNYPFNPLESHKPCISNLLNLLGRKRSRSLTPRDAAAKFV